MVRKTIVAIVVGLAAGWIFAGPVAAPAAEDPREFVELPAMMQDHMLANMRDHLAAVNEILDALSQDRIKEAGAIAEKRLGMSSLSMHGAAHMAPFMPERMQAIGTEMHHAASRFVTAAEDADLAEGAEKRQALFAALHEVTNTCVSCHEAFRIR